MKLALSILTLLLVLGAVFWYFEAQAPAHVPGSEHPSTGTGINPAASPYTYANASGDTVVVDAPLPNTTVSHSVTVSGKARGPWYFEASFPVTMLDKDGNVIAQGPAKANGDWMTNEFVPFSVVLTVPPTYTGPATIVLKKDNPSGEPQNDASVSYPVVIQ